MTIEAQSRRNANGNLTSDGTNTYTWNARNRLSAISGASTVSFVYDALGRRMSKTINGVTTQFLYDGLNPVQELNGATPPSVTANLLTGLNIDEYFARTDSNGTMAFLRDALGSTIGLVNSAGGIDTSYTYEPFGNTTISGSSGVLPNLPQIPEVDPSEVDWHCVTGCDTGAIMSALNVRVDPGTAAFLDRLARESGRSRSEVVREALEALREHGVRRPAVPPAEAMAHLIGCWDSGGKGLSERTGERFARLLREKGQWPPR